MQFALVRPVCCVSNTLLIPDFTVIFAVSVSQAPTNCHSGTKTLLNQFWSIRRYIRPPVSLPSPLFSSSMKPYLHPDYDLRARNGVRPLDAIRDYPEHAARRRLWNRGTSAALTKIYTRSLVRVVDEFLQALMERQGQKLDISHWLSFVTYVFSILLSSNENLMSFYRTDFMGHMT